MRARALRTVLAAAAALLGPAGCVYYNGMYNADRAAHEAQRFELQGRSAEARDRWQRAIVHAESVAARHPRSRWADDALLLRGRGLVQLESYVDAATVLEQAVRVAGSPALRAAALTLLGRANLALGRFAMARADLDSALESDQPAVTAEATLYRGRVLLALGALDAAFADFTASNDPQAPYYRAGVLLVRGDTAGARAQLELLAGVRPYRERQWRGILDTLAQRGAVAGASRLVERLVVRGDLTRGERARLLLDDGDRRVGARDTLQGRARYEQAMQAAADSSEARIGGVRLALLAAAEAATPADLAAASQQLGRLAADGGPAAREAQQVLRVLGQIERFGEETAAPDALWFFRAELLRDSVRAVRLATNAFAEMAGRFPASPWTPKAIVAAIAAGHPAADSLRALLDRRYGDSPYRVAAIGLAASGPEADAYRALEDSLGQVVASWVGARRTGERARPAVDDLEQPREARPGAAAPVRPAQPRPAAPTRPPPRPDIPPW